MTEPVEPIDFSALTATPLPDESFVMPNHTASLTGETVAPEPKRQTMRERLMAATGSKTETRARNVKPTKAKKSVPNVPGQFIEPLTDFYNMVAFVSMPFKPAVAMTLMGPASAPTEERPVPLTVAENCAHAWDEAAQRSESVRRFLDSMVGVSVWGRVFAAHAPLAVAMMEGSSAAGAMEAFLKRRAAQQESEQPEP